MKKTVLGLLLILFYCLDIYAANIKVVTEDFPPFQWKDNGLVVGPSAEIIDALNKRVGLETTLEMYPWARAYTMALNEENVLIYSIARIQKREKLFKWVGGIMFRNMYIWKLKQRKDIVVNSLEDAKRYTVVGVNQDARAEFLFSKGFQKDDNVVLVSQNNTALKLLFSGRVDLIVDTNAIEQQVEKINLDFSKLERTLYIEELSGEIYAAFSLMTTDEVVNQYKMALQQLKDEGSFDKIIKKYR